jgi:hypothetical protein
VLVKYMPEGQEQPTEWEFDPDRVRQSDAEMIEKRAGQRWNVWVEEIQAGSAASRRVLLWHLMRKQHHTLRLEDVPDFYMGELEIDYSLADLQKLRALVEESSLDDAEKTSRIQRLDLEIANRLSKEELDLGDLGKAPSNDAG